MAGVPCIGGGSRDPEADEDGGQSAERVIGQDEAVVGYQQSPAAGSRDDLKGSAFAPSS